jgi:hypothetical protein
VYIEVEVQPDENTDQEQEDKKDIITERILDQLEKTIENQSKQLENQSKQISEIKELVQNEQVLNRELLNRMPMLKAPDEEIQEVEKKKVVSLIWTFVLTVVILICLGVAYYLWYKGII